MAWKPRNYKKNLKLLKTRSHELNRKIEDGSFYELSYFARYREIRKIKQLYNRLMGPLSEGALKQAVSFASVLMLIAGPGCDSSSDDAMAQVTLQLNIDSAPAASPYSMASLSKAQAPDGVEDITLTISGADMKTIVKTISPSTGFISLLVPGGDDRLFQVRADMNNEDYYTGNTTADLVPGKLNTVSIPMTFVDVESEPPVPGNSGTILPGTTTFNSIDLSWTAGSDNVTSQADLEYAVYRSLSNNISTAADCETYGTLIQNYTPNLTAITVSDLTQETSYYFNVVVRDEAGNTAAYTMLNESTLSPDTVVPTPGASGTISMGTVTFNSIALSWTAATDDVSAQANLQYAVYLSTSNNISTPELCAANASPPEMDFTAGQTGYTITGLNPSTDYYVNVVVRDEAGNPAAYTMRLGTTDVMLPNFVLNTTSNPLDFVDLSGFPAFPSFGDIDGDGDMDLIVSSTPDNNIIQLFENESGSFNSITVPTTLVPDSIFRGFRVLANMDTDSDLDVLSIQYPGQGLYVFINSSGTAFSTFDTPSEIISNILVSSVLNGLANAADINGDGDQDVITGRTGYMNDNQIIQFYNNNGSGFDPGVDFGPGTSITFGYSIDPVFVDYDKDGDLDVVVGTGYYDTGDVYGRTYLYINTGDANNPVFSSGPTLNPFNIDNDLTTTNHVFPAFADIDEDGDLDMFIGTSSGTILYFENTVLP